MRAEVVDASAVAALLFGEPDAGRIADLLDGAELFAPSLLRYEIASVFLNKLAAYPSRRDALLTALRLYPRLGVVEAEVPPDELAELVDRAEVTACDAAYLWLARESGAALLTRVARRARAATELDLPLAG